jgi:hypothetical protein
MGAGMKDDRIAFAPSPAKLLVAVGPQVRTEGVLRL